MTSLNIDVSICVSYETEMNNLSTILVAQRYARQLTGSILFSGVNEDFIRSWLNRSSAYVEEYESGDFLFRKSDTKDRLGIILRGTADVSRISEDGMMHMSTLKRNDLFGAASLFGGDMAYVTDIRCNEKVRVLVIEENEMLALLSENRTVLLNYLRYLNGRIRFLNKRLDAFSKNTVTAKLQTFFTSEARKGVYTVKNYTKLSEMLCLSRATLYRALDALESSGKIKREGKQIILLEEYKQ